MFAGVHPEIYEQGAGGEKNLAASGQPRPKYRTAPVDSETVFRLPKVVACATREKAFFPVRAPSQKSYAPPSFLPNSRPNVSYSSTTRIILRTEQGEFLSRELGNQRSLVSINTPFFPSPISSLN